MEKSISIIVWIIIGTGIFGGLINYFRNVLDKDFKKTETIKPILLGLAASALVPLFLNMISSDLLKGEEIEILNYFIFLGFCLIASIFSGEFIDSIGKKVINQIREVKKEIEDSNTEDESLNIEEVNKIDSLDEKKKIILSAFINSRYTYRSISGLCKDTGLDKVTIKRELKDLLKLNLVTVVERQKGTKWKITSEGYKE